MNREDFPGWKSAPEGRRLWATWRVEWVFEIPKVHGGHWDRSHLHERPATAIASALETQS